LAKPNGAAERFILKSKTPG